jgi:ribonuclease BN (tRNA processing enzyme)
VAWRHRYESIGTVARLGAERGNPGIRHEVLDGKDEGNEVIYEEKGVVVRSIPAVHGLDGAVSFILEWNGLTFVYGSDTIPNKWYVEHSKGADIAIHECFLPPALQRPPNRKVASRDCHLYDGIAP